MKKYIGFIILAVLLTGLFTALKLVQYKQSVPVSAALTYCKEPYTCSPPYTPGPWYQCNTSNKCKACRKWCMYLGEAMQPCIERENRPGTPPTCGE